MADETAETDDTLVTVTTHSYPSAQWNDFIDVTLDGPKQTFG